MTEQIDALERLAKLHQSGALTDAEFAAQKAALFGSARAPASATPPVYTQPQGSDGIQPLWLLLGALGAVLLGVLIWWQMVDSKYEVEQVPAPGASASASASPSGVASTAAAAIATVPATPLAVIVPKKPTYNPSFSCTGQTANVLVMICQSRELSNKDRVLSDRFKAVLGTLDDYDKQALLRRQREFLRERNTCQDTECLHAWYDRVTAFYWE